MRIFQLLLISVLFSSCGIDWSVPEKEPLLDKKFALERKKEIDSYRSNNKRIPHNYYSYSGFRDFWRQPLVYPYSITAIDATEFCSIDNEWNCKDVETDNQASVQIQLRTKITRFTFNKKVLAAETNANFSEDMKEGFLLFHFNSEIITYFKTKEELIKAAAKNGIPEDAKYLTFNEYSEVLSY